MPVVLSVIIKSLFVGASSMIQCWYILPSLVPSIIHCPLVLSVGSLFFSFPCIPAVETFCAAPLRLRLFVSPVKIHLRENTVAKVNMLAMLFVVFKINIRCCQSSMMETLSIVCRSYLFLYSVLPRSCFVCLSVSSAIPHIAVRVKSRLY